MYSAFGLALALAFGAAPPFNGPPQPTKEQLKLVELMGDDSYHVREKANKDLEAMGWKALRALQGAVKHKDIEIARRAERSLAKYYGVSSDDKDTPIPSIWLLDNDHRWPDGQDGRDIAKHYYAKARKVYNKGRSPQETISPENWSEGYITQYATQLYIKDLLWKGMSHKKAKARLNGMVENAKNMYNENGTYGHDSKGVYRQISPPGKLLKREAAQVCPAQGVGTAVIRMGRVAVPVPVAPPPIMPKAIDK
jgi:hypothetical protein